MKKFNDTPAVLLLALFALIRHEVLRGYLSIRDWFSLEVIMGNPADQEVRSFKAGLLYWVVVLGIVVLSTREIKGVVTKSRRTIYGIILGMTCLIWLYLEFVK